MKYTTATAAAVLLLSCVLYTCCWGHIMNADFVRRSNKDAIAEHQKQFSVQDQTHQEKVAEMQRRTEKKEAEQRRQMEKKHFNNMSPEKQEYHSRQKRETDKRQDMKFAQEVKRIEKKLKYKSDIEFSTELKSFQKHKVNKDDYKSKKMEVRKKRHLNDDTVKHLHKSIAHQSKLLKNANLKLSDKISKKSFFEKASRKSMENRHIKMKARIHQIVKRKSALEEKLQKKLSNRKELKSMKRQTETILKHAPVYMKMGTTPEQRRALKKLRARVKREAKYQAESDLTATKAFLPKTRGAKSARYSEEDVNYWTEDETIKSASVGGAPDDDYNDVLWDLVDSFPFDSAENELEPRVPEVTIDLAEDDFLLHIPDYYNIETAATETVYVPLPTAANTPQPLPSSTTDVPIIATEALITDAVTTTPSTAEEVAPTTVRGPWPWETAIEGEERRCGQARFGRAARAHRGQRMLKILEGKEALPGSFPWQVLILDSDGDPLCGGTLIAPRWVLTAAHCIRKKLFVRLSEHHVHEKDGKEIQQKVRRIYKHPDFNSSTIDNDIALLRLPTLPAYPHPVTGLPSKGVVDRTCLPREEDDFPPVGTRCLVMGWGKASTSHSFGTDVLMYTRLPIISRKSCVLANRKTITDNMFCAGHYKGGSDTCSGDSGGPLLCSTGTTPGSEVWTLYGVTSFGDGCGNAGKMGVYAKVNNYIHWMAGIMNRYM